MLYRRFGRTELNMPVFSCGGMRYQHAWKDVPLEEVPADNQRNLEATIHRAIELGINHIETARAYGSSERQLGRILPTLPRDRIIVQTKIQPPADVDQFVHEFEQSLERLKLEHVDLLGLHGINNHRLLWYAVRPGGCLAAARKLQQQGKVGHVGFSTHGTTELLLDAVTWEGDGGFDYINLHYYYIFQDHRPVIHAAAQRDMGLFIISPSDKGGMLYQPPAKLVALCDPLPPIVFNGLWCLNDPRIHTLSIGATKPGDFDDQIRALDHLDRAARLLKPIEQRLRAAMVEAVGVDLADRFAEGLRPVDETPGHINIATILWLRNLALGWDMYDYAKMRYNLLGNGGTWFFGRNAADLDRYAEALSSNARFSPFADRLIDLLREAHALLDEAPQKRLSES